MTEKYEVVWAKTAENDLLKVIDYIILLKRFTENIL